MRADRHLAGALADAMLAGPWEYEDIHARCIRVLAGDPRWLGQLVMEVLETFHRPPLDGPRDFGAFVAATNTFGTAEQSDQKMPTPVVRLTAPTSTVSRPFDTPVLDNAAALAEHLNLTVDELILLADTPLKARRATSARVSHYRYRWINKPGGARLLEAPKPRLKAVQRQILDETLRPIPVHPAAHGFVAGRSAITGAAQHLGATTVISMDLEHCFASITAGRIWGVLRAAGYPEPVAHLLTGLTTHATAVSALTQQPQSSDVSRDFRLRRRLAAPHLPQGSPTSPQLANLVLFSLDRRLHAYAAASGMTYTRYADDLTFSGRAATSGRSLIAAVEKMVLQEGFRLNPAKSRVRHRSDRQCVTGIVVNEHPNLARPEFDRLKAVLHDCIINGGAAANRHGHNDYRSHLRGRISWVSALNPDRGAKLMNMFQAIQWEG